MGHTAESGIPVCPRPLNCRQREEARQVKPIFILKIDRGMPQTDTKMTAVWGIPLLFEIKLSAADAT
jgi:hypothetical protein